MIHSFLLIGQSNMAGRGFYDEAPEIDSKNIKILRNGRWQAMFRPVNPDRSFSGVCLAEYFAEKYKEDFGVEVGLIPCADGRTSIDQWCEGGLLFDHACYMAELASRTSTIAGVLWHQGEADCPDDRYPVYQEKLEKVMEALRRKTGLNDVPFLLGALGDYLKDNQHKDIFKNAGKINQAIKNVADKNEMMAYVPATGLTSNPDYLHFNAASLKEFGLRYYEEYLKIYDKNKVFEEKVHPDLAVRTEMEKL